MINRKKYTQFNNSKAIILCLILTLLPVFKLICQPIPVGSLKEQQYRVLQLLSDSTITTSFLSRPIWNSTYQKVFNPSNSNSQIWWRHPVNYWETTMTIHEYNDYKVHLGIYNPVLINTYNSELPLGQNNGAAWYGRGLNTELKLGFYLTSKYVTITLRPNFIYTQNKYFPPPIMFRIMPMEISAGLIRESYLNIV